MHLLALLLALSAQRPDSLAAQVREYVAVDTSLLALTHVLVLDGTGGAPKSDQTIVIRGGRIAAVGPAASVQLPAGARVMDMSGSTVIPGIVGMHDHLFYTAAGGRAVQMSYTGPRLYLGSGVTTIRTTLRRPLSASSPTGRRKGRRGSSRTPTFAAPSWGRRSRRRTSRGSRSPGIFAR